MEKIISYFLNDPLKVLYFLGGTGGVWFWIEKWLDRIQVRVRPISHFFDVKADEVEMTLTFEAVNIGKSPTSLEPSLLCTGYSVHRQRRTATLHISEAERILPPHSTRTFTAVGRTDPTYAFWLFKSFRVSPTRGCSQTMYSRSNPRNVLGRFRYYIELALYRWLNWLPFISGKERDNESSG